MTPLPASQEDDIPAGLARVPTLVDPGVSRAKVQRDLDAWDMQRDVYRARGWVLLDVYNGLVVDVAMFSRLEGTTPGPVPTVPVCVRIDYRNYDLWAPSVTFIDPLTRSPAPPPVRAFNATPSGPRDVLLDAHPTSGRPFLCLPGVREYHEHPQHSGDYWLLHRSQGTGSLLVLCERLWRLMARSLVGVSLELVVLKPPMGGQFTLRLVQGDPDAPPAASPPVQEQPPS